MKSRFSLYLTLGAATISLLGTGASSATGQPALTAGEQRFVKTSAAHGLAEVKLGQLAARRAAGADVRRFGRRMATDHTKANKELADLAAAKRVALPTQPDAASRPLLVRLGRTTGVRFDRLYMAEMVKGHAHMLTMLQAEIRVAKDPDLRAWIEQTMPTVREHLREGRRLARTPTGRRPAP